MSDESNPFQSPNLPPPQYAGPGPVGLSWIIPFESGRPRAVWAIGLLAAQCVAMVGIAATAITMLPAIEAAGAGALDDSRVQSLRTTALVMSIVDSLLYYATVVPYAMWVHRAARNLAALGGRGLKYPPGWAVGWFFIPFAHLVMPVLVVAEIWRESDPAQRRLDGLEGKRTSPLVGLWWATYLAYQLIPLSLAIVVGVNALLDAARTGRGADLSEATILTPAVLRTQQLITVGSSALGIVAAALAIAVVHFIDKNQQTKHELMLKEPVTR